jgi:hypothetical protein
MANEPNTITVLRSALNACVGPGANRRRLATQRMKRFVRDVEHLAHWGGSSNAPPAMLREAAASCARVAELVHLRDAREFGELMRSEPMVQAFRRARIALAAFGGAVPTVTRPGDAPAVEVLL